MCLMADTKGLSMMKLVDEDDVDALVEIGSSTRTTFVEGSEVMVAMRGGWSQTKTGRL